MKLLKLSLCFNIIISCFNILCFHNLFASDRIISLDKLKKLQDYVESVPEINEFKKVIQDNSSAVVLIYAVSDTGKDEDYYYNTAIQPRKSKSDYRYGVTSGVIISQDGIIVTTYDNTTNSDKFIVAIDSENNTLEKLSNKIVISDKTREANVVMAIPELNLLFLKIKTIPGEEFDFLPLGNDSALLCKKYASNFLLNGAVIVGKAKGNHYVTLRNTKNNINKFDKYCCLVDRMCIRNLDGCPTILIYAPFTGEGVLPEANGGAIISYEGKLLGLALYKDHLNFPISFGIPVSTIKKGLSIAFPGPIKYELITNIKMEVGKLNSKQKEELLEYVLTDKAIESSIAAYYDSNTKLPDVKKIIKNDELGVSVVKVEENSVAYKVGIKPNDILLTLNENVISNIKTFYNLVNHAFADQTITVACLRNGSIIQYELRK